MSLDNKQRQNGIANKTKEVDSQVINAFQSKEFIAAIKNNIKNYKLA